MSLELFGFDTVVKKAFHRKHREKPKNSREKESDPWG